jgi:hypothetical protein
MEQEEDLSPAAGHQSGDLSFGHRTPLPPSGEYAGVPSSAASWPSELPSVIANINYYDISKQSVADPEILVSRGEQLREFFLCTYTTLLERNHRVKSTQNIQLS